MGYRYMSGYRGLKGLYKEGLKGLNISWFDGLSIVTLEPLTLNRYIVISICRQIDKPYIPHIQHIPHITDIKVCQYPFQTRVYKDIPNTPIDRQTISSGYKGLDILGYKGLKV